MAYEFDLTASQQRIDRIDSIIAAQKLYIIATCLERRAAAELNLRTLEGMRIRLGLSQDVLMHRVGGSKYRLIESAIDSVS